MINVSTRTKNIVPSASLAVSAKAANMREQGIDVIALSAGEPDVAMPKAIQIAANKALEAGYTKYTKVEQI